MNSSENLNVLQRNILKLVKWKFKFVSKSVLFWFQIKFKIFWFISYTEEFFSLFRRNHFKTLNITIKNNKNMSFVNILIWIQLGKNYEHYHQIQRTDTSILE